MAQNGTKWHKMDQSNQNRDLFDTDNLTRDPDTIHITSAPDAPLPKITILTSDGREASTVRIGDRLTFRIEIPENTPYGIFARSCVAMAKDARSTFEIIDDNGCPVDHTIFPNFIQTNNALESQYEAFRFTESYGVIFQCNVKYCIGKCDSVSAFKTLIAFIIDLFSLLFFLGILGCSLRFFCAFLRLSARSFRAKCSFQHVQRYSTTNSSDEQITWEASIVPSRGKNEAAIFSPVHYRLSLHTHTESLTIA